MSAWRRWRPPRAERNCWRKLLVLHLDLGLLLRVRSTAALAKLKITRRIIPNTRAELGVRTRLRSSLMVISKQWCKRLSMTQYCRLSWSMPRACNWPKVRLLNKNTTFLVHWVPRLTRVSKRAANRAPGKPTWLGVTSRDSRKRISRRPRLRSRVSTRVRGVG
jgi:hypothetical protein